ncbi:hypothetical protein RHSIM_RhsimUnG0199700 [Rhododendron simsii]|uniref:Uncharacterized protein n=1 Tax=Rhododendron simsii TaxID=118357 RepID=A0A834FTS2_RHOSS|nr:hypothetical protein RHSIM_RhsimUnG0199700 [Rhododendron simsii]
MAEPPSPSTNQTSTSTSSSSSGNTEITDMNMDSLVHCASYLNLRDISNLAMSCSYLRRVAYSDPIWLRFSRERWSEQISSSFPQASGAREAYLARHTALNQFKFIDPLVADSYKEAQPFNHLFLDKNDIIFSQEAFDPRLDPETPLIHRVHCPWLLALLGEQLVHQDGILGSLVVVSVNDCFTIHPRHHQGWDVGHDDYIEAVGIMLHLGSLVHMMRIDSFLGGRPSLSRLFDHNATITCIRLFPLVETSLFRSETQRNDNALITSSCDHSIRLWWKGTCRRCFRGHNGPVTTLSDKLLGDGSGKIFASGGVDATVRLWSLSSTGKRGQQALKATLYGHDKAIVSMSVAGHKSSLLVSISKYSKVRVWDTTTASSAVRSSCCVGVTSVLGAPVGMKCHESLVYVATGSSVVAIDLRTMQKVFTAAIRRGELFSFEALPSKSLICAGGTDRAMLWDIRRSSEPMTVLDGHTGAVTQLHMDPYKIVTGGVEDSYVHIWETDTGVRTNSLFCGSPDASSSSPGCSAMAVNGCRIVTTSYRELLGLIRYRDFTNATCLVSSDLREHGSKFWGPQSYSDTDESDG